MNSLLLSSFCCGSAHWEKTLFTLSRDVERMIVKVSDQRDAFVLLNAVGFCFAFFFLKSNASWSSGIRFRKAGLKDQNE